MKYNMLRVKLRVIVSTSINVFSYVVNTEYNKRTRCGALFR